MSRRKQYKAPDDLPALPLQNNLAVTWLDIGTLKPNPRNARTHNRHQKRALSASLRTFGWTKPIIIDGNRMVVAGHGCLEAAKLLGLKTVPVIQRSDLTKEQVRLYALADNKLAQKSGWDFELLAIELKELGDLGEDISLTGFEFDEIEGLLDDFYPANDGEDEIPVPPSASYTVARRGDLFVLGKHRLICGDATSSEDVERLIEGAEPVLMVTDPPYGVKYNPGWRHEAGVNGSKRSRGIQNDHRSDWRDAWALFPGPVAYVWHAAVHADVFHGSLVASGFDIRAEIVWVKSRFAIGRGDYHWAHEPAFYAVRKGCSANWCGNRKQTTVCQIGHTNNGPDRATDHPTQKPVECMRRPILNNSRRGQAVYDPFMGSGTTLIAAERTGRVAYGLELDPSFVDVIIRRWQGLTGKDAKLAGTDQTFDELAVERQRESAAEVTLAERRSSGASPAPRLRTNAFLKKGGR